MGSEVTRASSADFLALVSSVFGLLVGDSKYGKYALYGQSDRPTLNAHATR